MFWLTFWFLMRVGVGLYLLGSLITFGFFFSLFITKYGIRELNYELIGMLIPMSFLWPMMFRGFNF